MVVTLSAAPMSGETARAQPAALPSGGTGDARSFARWWFSIFADVVITSSLLLIGSSQGAASLAGATAGCLVYLAIRGGVFLMGSTTGRRVAPGVAATLAWYLACAAAALALRGGVIATALRVGIPNAPAALAGVAAGWTVLYVLEERLFGLRSDSLEKVDPRLARAAPAILVGTVLLRIVYLDVLPLLPEEAYYWNYSIHLDIGYMDHPPMVAWLIALGEHLLGPGEASVRSGSLLCGLIAAYFVHRLARRLVDATSALVAAALVGALPYFLFGAGLVMSPDAPLIASWAAALYFFQRALVGGERDAWYGVGAAIGVGLLSKYTIALLGPSAVAFVVLDRASRRWLTRPEPYVAIALALALFAPVIAWNYQHDWASFAFQSGGRFGAESRFSLHVLLGNVLAVATPLPFIVLPLLCAKGWTNTAHSEHEPAHANPCNRLFVACFVIVPLLVFGWSALRHEPRLNWTGPVWLAVLPLLGWVIVHAGTLRSRGLRTVIRVCAGPIVVGALAVGALGLYYAALGFPGLAYPKSFARTAGWSGAARTLQVLHDQMAEATGLGPVLVGMDKYNIASELSYYIAQVQPDPADSGSLSHDRPNPIEVTSRSVFGEDGLMFSYWNTPEQFRGRTLIMVSPCGDRLESNRLSSYFDELDPQTHSLALRAEGPGADRRVVDFYCYRIGYGFRPRRDGHDSRLVPPLWSDTPHALSERP